MKSLGNMISIASKIKRSPIGVKERITLAWAAKGGWDIVGRFILNGQRAIRLKRGCEKLIVYPYTNSYRYNGRYYKGIESRLKGTLEGPEMGEL